jgi:hypothetical protein
MPEAAYKPKRKYRPSHRRGKGVNLTKRVCLKCDADFMSEGIENRICSRCQGSNSALFDTFEVNSRQQRKNYNQD